MDCSPTPEPPYLNLPDWRCVPVYALPYMNCRNPAMMDAAAASPIDARSLLPSSIPLDPKVWTRQQVHVWLEWCIDNLCLPPMDVEQFCMNGRGLCLLTKSDWRDRAPRSGDILFNALQVLLQKQGSYNGSNNNSHHTNNCSPTENISAALLHQAAFLHHAAMHEKSISQHPPGNMWQRSVSSDYHSMGHVVQENELTNGGTNVANGGSDDTDSITAGSPAHSPSPNCNNPQEPNNEFPLKNSHVENGSIKDPNVSPTLAASHISHLSQQFANGIPENGVEKINVRLLWDFLQQLLNDQQQRYTSCIIWKDKSRGVFKITDPHRLAGLWGKQKNHLNMNFDKMSRALRYYYRVRILQKEPGEKHCYRFLRHPNELRHCKQRSLLPKENGTPNSHSSPLECSDIEAVLDMSIKEEGSSPGDPG